MCGRFSISVTKAELLDYLQSEFEISEIGDDIYLPRFNVAPSQKILSIVNDGKKNRIGLIRWGLVPSFAKDESIGSRMINAKSETIVEKPSFTASLKTKRCVILADGFFEWDRQGKTKTPMRFVLGDQKLFPMAGLWSTFVKPDGSKLFTCAIITTQANGIVSPFHDRMPVILDSKSQSLWLNPAITDPWVLQSLLLPYDESRMRMYEVSRTVNNANTDTVECIHPVG
jgi:putative SOS response-associated peptidase YedK